MPAKLRKKSELYIHCTYIFAIIYHFMHNKPSLLPLFNAKVGNQTTIRWFESDKRLKIGNPHK